MFKKSAVSLVFAIAASNAVAATSFNTGEFYGGVDIGYNDMMHSCGSACETDGVVLGLVGGYQFNDWLSGELGYVLEPNYDFAGEQLIIHSGSVGFKFAKSIDPKNNLFVSPGMMVSELMYDDRQYDESVFNPYIEAGIESKLTSNLIVQLKYRYRGNGRVDHIGEIESSQYMLSLRYGFGSDVDRHHDMVASTLPVEFESDEKVKPLYVANDSGRVVTVETIVLSESSGNRVLFDNASSAIVDASGLSAVVERLASDKVQKIEIIGHTDSNGSESYNLTLSVERAQAVRGYLIDHGVDSSIMYVDGRGEMEPIGDNSMVDGRALNRRVELKVWSSQVN